MIKKSKKTGVIVGVIITTIISSISMIFGIMLFHEGVTKDGQFSYYNSLNVSQIEYIGNEEKIKIPNRINFNSVRYFSTLEENLANVKYIEVDEHNKYFSSLDGALYNKDKTTLIYYPTNAKEPKIAPSVKTIGDSAFNHTNFEKLIIPEGVEEIENDLIIGCDSVKEIILPSTLKGKQGYDIIANCNSLESVTLNVRNIETEDYDWCACWQFINLPNLKELHIDKSITMESLVTHIAPDCRDVKVYVDGTKDEVDFFKTSSCEHFDAKDYEVKNVSDNVIEITQLLPTKNIDSPDYYTKYTVIFKGGK